MTLRWIDRLTCTLLALLCAVLLAACGGGGSGGGCTTIDPNRDPNLPGCGGTTTPATKPAITLTMTDAAGAAVSTLAPGAMTYMTPR